MNHDVNTWRDHAIALREKLHSDRIRKLFLSPCHGTESNREYEPIVGRDNQLICSASDDGTIKLATLNGIMLRIIRE
jgi:hypothetical protein